MAEIIDLTNYRKKFKEHYNIDFSGDYEIHHIDENRDNNDISNLMLLPVALHKQYHIFKRVIDRNPLPTRICGNQANNGTYYLNYYERFISIIHECNKWYDYKLFLDGKLQNIHGIELN